MTLRRLKLTDCRGSSFDYKVLISFLFALRSCPRLSDGPSGAMLLMTPFHEVVFVGTYLGFRISSSKVAFVPWSVSTSWRTFF